MSSADFRHFRRKASSAVDECIDHFKRGEEAIEEAWTDGEESGRESCEATHEDIESYAEQDAYKGAAREELERLRIFRAHLPVGASALAGLIADRIFEIEHQWPDMSPGEEASE